MSGTKERWQELCEQVIAEHDSQRLSELVAMLNSELEKRESRARQARSAQNTPSKSGRTSSDVA
jgi:hypothetical protein